MQTVSAYGAFDSSIQFVASCYRIVSCCDMSRWMAKFCSAAFSFGSERDPEASKLPCCLRRILGIPFIHYNNIHSSLLISPPPSTNHSLDQPTVEPPIRSETQPKHHSTFSDLDIWEYQQTTPDLVRRSSTILAGINMVSQTLSSSLIHSSCTCLLTNNRLPTFAASSRRRRLPLNGTQTPSLGIAHQVHPALSQRRARANQLATFVNILRPR